MPKVPAVKNRANTSVITNANPHPAGAGFLAGDSEMAGLMRGFDWSGSPVGPIESWSPALRSMLSILLANRLPMLLWWGPRYISFYNDAYRPILGTKHPAQALGLPVSECWSEIWPVLKPLIDTPFEGGPATWMDDIPLEINRHGFLEETHFTIAYSPVPDESVPGNIGGVLATVHEITEKIIGERRMVILHDLAAGLIELPTSAEELCRDAVQALVAHAKDFSFALLYLLEADLQHARLVGAAGVAEGSLVSPRIIDIGQAANDPRGWPVGTTARTKTMQTVDDLAERFGDHLPPGPWSDRPHQAVIVPLGTQGAQPLTGFLIFGVSSRLKLDDNYRNFIELIARQISTGIATAHTYTEDRRRAGVLAELALETRNARRAALNLMEDALQSGRIAEALNVQVRESEERYRGLFNSMDEGYCTIEMIFDERGKPVDYVYREINPSFEKLTGMRGALGKRISEFVPNLEEHWYEMYGKVALTGEPIRVSDEVKGMNRWFDIYAFRIGGNDSREVAVLFRNITESKQAERLTEMLSRLSLELASAAEAAEIIEIAVEAVGRHLNGHRCYFVECLADENRLCVSHNWVRDEAPTIEGELSLFDFGGIEWWREFASGDFIMEDVSTNPLTQANSASYHAVGVPSYAVQPFRRDADWTVCLVVTEKSPRKWTAYDLRVLADVVARVWPMVERARADRALRASEAQLSLALNSSGLGIWNVDPVTNALSSDARFRAILGGGTEELSYEQSFTIVHPDDRDAVRDKVAAAIRPDDPTPYEAEYRVVHADGSVHWVLAKGRANFADEAEGRRLLSFDGTVADITERKRGEESLHESAQALVDLHRRKDEFLAMLSHELRNPLAPIANALQLLRLQPNEDPLQQQARTIIERQVGQLNHLVDDLLEVSRITTGRVQLRRDRVAMSGIVERAVETAHPLLLQRRHELTVTVSPQPIWVYADAARLEQVVVNLLTNAAKYTDDGGRIGLSIEQAGDSAVLRVRDTGIGISPELLPHIFDLFTQAERSLDRSQGGLGIGLSLVQRLVDLHGGTVDVYSVLGQGSEFVVRLPVMLTALPPVLSPRVLSAPIESALPSAKCCRVLVVDDNVDATESLAMLLTMTGHEVHMAYDGPSALEAAIAVRPDVMLLDIGLPGLTGHEVATRIREHATLNNIVLIAMTGYGHEADLKSSRDAGFDHHLVKPADFAEVQRILAAVGVGAKAHATPSEAGSDG